MILSFEFSWKTGLWKFIWMFWNVEGLLNYWQNAKSRRAVCPSISCFSDLSLLSPYNWDAKNDNLHDKLPGIRKEFTTWLKLKLDLQPKPKIGMQALLRWVSTLRNDSITLQVIVLDLFPGNTQGTILQTGGLPCDVIPQQSWLSKLQFASPTNTYSYGDLRLWSDFTPIVYSAFS